MIEQGKLYFIDGNIDTDCPEEEQSIGVNQKDVVVVSDNNIAMFEAVYDSANRTFAFKTGKDKYIGIRDKRILSMMAEPTYWHLLPVDISTNEYLVTVLQETSDVYWTMESITKGNDISVQADLAGPTMPKPPKQKWRFRHVGDQDSVNPL